MSKPKTYAEAGVDSQAIKMARRALDEWREEILKVCNVYPLKLPYNEGYCYPDGRVFFGVIDGIGTKQLICNLLGKNDVVSYDTYGMVVDDIVRNGARARFVLDYIACEGNISENLADQLGKGLYEASIRARVPVLGGETASVKDIIKPIDTSWIENAKVNFKLKEDLQNYDFACACFGDAEKREIITGKKIKEGDTLIGLLSSGYHLNGLTLARKTLINLWGGAYDLYDVPGGYEESVGEMLTKRKVMYYPAVLEMKEKGILKAFHHNTGSSFKKMEALMRYSNLGFLINNLPSPLPIFQLTYETLAKENKGNEKALLTELYSSLNMGVGGIVVCSPSYSPFAIDIAKSYNIEAQEIGRVVKEKKLVIETPEDSSYPKWMRNKKIRLI